MTGLFRVKALYEYSSPHEDDLTFSEGQVITVTEADEEDWYTGEFIDDDGVKRDGLFPRNYVDKIEPVAPPRPARHRPKKDDVRQPAVEQYTAPSEPEPTPVQEEPAPEPAPVPAPEPEEEPEDEEPAASPPPPQPAPVPIPVASAAKPAAQTSAPPVAATKASEPRATSPPPVSEKPSGNSFKDRIAAFNKTTAPPIAPFKPSGLNAGGGGGAGFIKKPFVAPPPSRNAYVPPPQKAPVAKIYKREEDPEIKTKEQEDQEQAERAGLVPSESAEGAEDEDQPKPTTLKERIALLQKQQREQAMRHADPGAKKEKPKKPPKKPSDAAPPPAHAPAEEIVEEHDAASEVHDTPPPPVPVRRSTEEARPRTSADDGSAVSRPPPSHRRKSSRGQTLETLHDGNDADMSGAGDTTEGQDDTTEREDDDDQPPRQAPQIPLPIPGAAPPPIASRQPEAEDQAEKTASQGEDDDAEEEEDDDVDPEVKRKEELRARMAKMSGGMGFHGMFGVPVPGAGAPSKKKAPKPEAAPVQEEEAEEPTARAPQPIPAMMALPGMGGPRKSSEDAGRRSEDSVASQHSAASPATRAPPPPIPSRGADQDDSDQEEDEDDETTPALTPAPSSALHPLPVPPTATRPPPPPVPSESRPPPPPVPGNVQSPTEGSASDYDEPTDNARDDVTDKVTPEAPPPPGLPPTLPISTQTADIPLRSPPMSPVATEGSPLSPTSKRSSRVPPPIPGSAPAPPPASTRPPPPPPPGPGGLSRQSTSDAQPRGVELPPRPPQAGEENDSQASEYEGDYDTDIASYVPHKDALKGHARASSLEEALPLSPADVPPSAPPPVPSAAAPRAVPPPIPSQPPPESRRRSVDFPRSTRPPPPPASNPISPAVGQDDYDPYNYAAPGQKTTRIDEEGELPSVPSSPQAERRAVPAAPTSRGRPSLEMGRLSMSNRRSVDMARPGVDSSFIAEDIDLGVQSGWWKQANQVPPALQGRRDVFYECDDATTTNQGSKTEITREIWVLFQDYSQTIITVRYDPYDASDAELEQRHEPPPRSLRQDQMEDFYERFGRPISEAAAAKKDTVVGDGTPMGLVLELLRPFRDALKPVGTRAFGALVYSNMGNASTQQHDVIRAGDIISIRNARFQGKHGPMHAKYSAEVGKPDHVAVVAEWDGTKKKVRAWEQGRESKKVKQESFKLDDLRSGEVKIWRVMPRSWVGWNSLA
ncbi:myosin tail region-interacting protein MTI1 [Geosmithia morbida]|uniref:Myosin tail region-interacting protein MTI1 n=1 Tax=Geosmithia morbida TaxID=1094350 RepID=A0A9P4YUD1_9HYPO|nr:myosin tail region-interacting protein MTI1 [Geosmithia morbida]KAF4122970.1 myosin tail region-interacting protein MTI1 [Geosmithia morbida]